MYFSYGIFVDNRVPNFWGEFDSCLNFYTKCTPPLCFAQQNIGEVARSDVGVSSTKMSENIREIPARRRAQILQSPYTLPLHR